MGFLSYRVSSIFPSESLVLHPLPGWLRIQFSLFLILIILKLVQALEEAALQLQVH